MGGHTSIDEAALRLRSAKTVTILTGAGVSAESGVPTFRDALHGLWSQFRPEDLATPEAFRRQPDVVWQWYQARHHAVLACLPNAAHHAVAALERHLSVNLITQNVDGLHRRAGSNDPIELHGNLLRLRCVAHGHPAEWPATDTELPPACDICGSLLRPDVVWFGEGLPSDALRRAYRATERCDLFLSVGTSNIVEPAASLPWAVAQRGTPVLIINLSMEGQEWGPLIGSLLGAAGEVLPELFRRAFPEQ